MTNEDVVRQMEDQRRPFTEEFVDKNTVIRSFDSKADDHLYKWHRDPEDREITVLNENDWKFQFDNEIPQKLESLKISGKKLIIRLTKLKRKSDQKRMEKNKNF